jgi:hypothetical protein
MIIGPKHEYGKLTSFYGLGVGIGFGEDVRKSGGRLGRAIFLFSVLVEGTSYQYSNRPVVNPNQIRSDDHIQSGVRFDLTESMVSEGFSKDRCRY